MKTVFVDQVNPEHQIEAYGVKCQLLGKNPEISKAAVNVTHCVLEPGSKTSRHQHREAETFFVLSGRGSLEVGESQIELRPGSSVTTMPFHSHVLINDGPEDLTFLSLYSDFSLIAESSKPQMVIVAPPTPNGDLHLGHLGGPYLASDIYRRYLSLRGKSVFFLSGTDDHQNYIERYAKEMSLSSAEVAEKFRNSILKTLGAADVQFNEFVHPQKDASYKQFVVDFFAQLLERGFFEIRILPTFFDSNTGDAVLESQIRGLCPACQKEVVGNCCEECGFVGDVSHLLKPQHVDGRDLEVRPLSRAVLNLKKIQKTDFSAGGLFEESLALMADRSFKYADFFPVSYPGSWGLSTGSERLSGQVINVWVEMAAGYVFSSIHLRKEFLDREKFDTHLFCGTDNSFYYSVLIPGILAAFKPELKRPYQVQLNEFWNLDGSKFSTSRRHAIWGREFLRKEESDFLRFYMAYRRPLFMREDFTMRDYYQDLESLKIKSIDSMTESLKKLFSEKNPKEMNQVSFDTLVELQDILNQYEKNFVNPNMGIKRNAHLLAFLILRVLDFEKRCLKSKSKLGDFIYGMRILGTLLVPYMPVRAKAILSFFESKSHWIHDVSLAQAQQEMSCFFEFDEYRRAE